LPASTNRLSDQLQPYLVQCFKALNETLSALETEHNREVATVIDQTLTSIGNELHQLQTQAAESIDQHQFYEQVTSSVVPNLQWLIKQLPANSSWWQWLTGSDVGQPLVTAYGNLQGVLSTTDAVNQRAPEPSSAPKDDADQNDRYVQWANKLQSKMELSRQYRQHESSLTTTKRQTTHADCAAYLATGSLFATNSPVNDRQCDATTQKNIKEGIKKAIKQAIAYADRRDMMQLRGTYSLPTTDKLYQLSVALVIGPRSTDKHNHNRVCNYEVYCHGDSEEDKTLVAKQVCDDDGKKKLLFDGTKLEQLAARVDNPTSNNEPCSHRAPQSRLTG
jgi:hypothetical protein